MPLIFIPLPLQPNGKLLSKSPASHSNNYFLPYICVLPIGFILQDSPYFFFLGGSWRSQHEGRLLWLFCACSHGGRTCLGPLQLFLNGKNNEEVLVYGIKKHFKSLDVYILNVAELVGQVIAIQGVTKPLLSASSALFWVSLQKSCILLSQAKESNATSRVVQVCCPWQSSCLHMRVTSVGAGNSSV